MALRTSAYRRLVSEQLLCHRSLWAAGSPITTRLGCTSETLRRRLLKAEQRTVAHQRSNALSGNSIAHDRTDTFASIPRRVAPAGAAPSVGSGGDAHAYARDETAFGLFKTEVVQLNGPIRCFDDVEMATLVGGAWFNRKRMPESLDSRPPAEHEINACNTYHTYARAEYSHEISHLKTRGD